MDNVFSICMAGPDDAGGVLQLGGVDPTLYTGEIFSVKITQDKFYEVEGVSINLHRTDGSEGFRQDLRSYVDNRGQRQKVLTFVDSGTAFMNIPTAAYKQIISSLESDGAVSVGGGFYEVPQDFEPSFKLSITLGHLAPNMQLQLPVVGWFGLTKNKKRLFPFLAPTDGEVVLGQAFMSAYNTVFNRAGNTVGFAKTANCKGAAWTSTDAILELAKPQQCETGCKDPEIKSSPLVCSFPECSGCDFCYPGCDTVCEDFPICPTVLLECSECDFCGDFCAK